MDYQDILYDERDGSARIAINRPDVMNAFRGQTVEELLHALQRAGWNKQIAVIVLTGTGDRAFCTGGDQSSHSGQYDGRGIGSLGMQALSLYDDAAESKEGVAAFLEKRKPDFRRHV